MSDIILKKPDYKSNAYKDIWSIKDFAMLLNDVCPDTYKSHKCENDRSTPPGFEAVRSTYIMLRAIKWKDKYPKFHTRNGGNHPIVYIHEDKMKGIPLSEMLWASIEERYQQEIDEVINTGNGKSSALITRERNNLLRGIGLLVSILIDEKEKHSKNSGMRISASQIARLVMNKAEYLGVDQEGLKSFERKITAAVNLINENTNEK